MKQTACDRRNTDQRGGAFRKSQWKFAESDRLAREVMEMEQKNQPDDWQRFRAESLLGAAWGKKKYGEAQPLLTEGYQGMVATEGRIALPDSDHLDPAHGWIVELYEARGKPGEGNQVEAKAKLRATRSRLSVWQGTLFGLPGRGRV